MRFIQFIMFSSMVLCCSCGSYRWDRSGATQNPLFAYRTLTIPYVEGDVDGSITSALIKQVCSNGAFKYRQEGGSLTLKVKVINYFDENIGYRYDRNSHGKRIKSIIPVETRMTLITEVKVIEAASGTVVLGPVNIITSVDFDHDYYSSQNGINIFSLGQLSDIDEAQDAVQLPLNDQLAKKITAYITDNWQ